MPNAKILSEKQAIVADLTEKIQGAAGGVLVDYKGITVAEDTALRAEMRKNGVDYAVVKNTLTRFAVKNAGLEELSSVLEGTTSLAVSATDPVAPARVVSEFSKKMNGEKFIVKAGFVDGKVISVDEVKALADLPSKEVLLSMLLLSLIHIYSTLPALISFTAWATLGVTVPALGEGIRPLGPSSLPRRPTTPIISGVATTTS